MRKFTNSQIFIVSVFVFLLLSKMVLSAGHLPIPTIAIHPDIYYPFDEVLYLEGRAEPNSTIQIQFQKQGAKPLILNTKSDGNGEWVLAEKVPLEAGDWQIRARVAKSSGAVSDWSNPRIFKAIVTGILIGGITIKFTLLATIIAVLLILGGIGAWYYTRRARHINEEFQKKLREKERESVEVSIEQNFAELKQSIMRELEHIEGRLKGGKLTDEEKEHREHLLRELKEVEATIEKKVKNLS